MVKITPPGRDIYFSTIVLVLVSLTKSGVSPGLV
jgi:hypothetical protein